MAPLLGPIIYIPTLTEPNVLADESTHVHKSLFWNKDDSLLYTTSPSLH